MKLQLPVKLKVGNLENSSPFTPYMRASFSSSSVKAFSVTVDASTSFPPLALSQKSTSANSFTRLLNKHDDKTTVVYAIYWLIKMLI